MGRITVINAAGAVTRLTGSKTGLAEQAGGKMV